jgi:hypothetical protein
LEVVAHAGLHLPIEDVRVVPALCLGHVPLPDALHIAEEAWFWASVVDRHSDSRLLAYPHGLGLHDEMDMLTQPIPVGSVPLFEPLRLGVLRERILRTKPTYTTS